MSGVDDEGPKNSGVDNKGPTKSGVAGEGPTKTWTARVQRRGTAEVQRRRGEVT